tara:strand:+ start:1517 stop:1918 length:402 start_codon:yes stop_codon:yes gene_type:complete
MNILSILRNQNFIQIIKFIIVGIFGNILNYLVFLTCFKLLGINYLISGIIGFISPLPILFILNRNWTFKSNVKTTKMNLYIFTNLLGLLVHSSSQFIAFEFIGIPKIYSQLIGQLSSAIMNFLISKFIIFKKN